MINNKVGRVPHRAREGGQMPDNKVGRVPQSTREAGRGLIIRWAHASKYECRRAETVSKVLKLRRTVSEGSPVREKGSDAQFLSRDSAETQRSGGGAEI